MENEFLKKCIAWLQKSPGERDLNAGAMLMLQANRNKILYQNMIRKPNAEKIEYEIQKYVKANTTPGMEDAIEVKNITEMDRQVYELQKQKQRDGERIDHHSLPENIKSLVEQNIALYHEMRSLHEKLKLLSGDNYSPEQREPIILELLEKNEKVRENWNAYDSFDNKKIVEDKKEDEPLTVQDVQKHRTYLSRASEEVPAKIAAGKTEQADKQKAEAQRRFDILVKGGQKFDADLLDKLKSIGINVG